MKLGFVLRRLALTGHGMPTAELAFVRGLNVIAGPSDTGKTFIAQCVDYALGSGDTPKPIPEAAAYTTVVLEIESQRDSRCFTLQRSLRGGEVRVSSEGQQDRVLAAKHQGGKEDTISQFLLELCGLDGKMVRTNQLGNTRPVSFRDIAPLAIVDEESVIKDASPVLPSNQYIKNTAEAGVFRLLLTGIDDSSVVAREDPKLAKGRQDGKAEVLEILLQRARDQLDEVEGIGTADKERERLERLDGELESAAADLATEQKSASALEDERRVAWTRLREVESRLNVLAELGTRFDLLREQYASDLRRLDTIAEAGLRLGQMTEERCPVCGAPAEHHEPAHQKGNATPANVVQACKAEAMKTATLLQDLETTRASTTAEVKRLAAEKEADRTRLETIGTELKTLLQPRVEIAVKKVQDARDQRDASRRAVELLERVEELEELLAKAAAPLKKAGKSEVPSAVTAGQAEQFSKEVQGLLQSWHFPNLDRVTFSDDEQDIVISGHPRKSHGKGVRAITRAAFNLALLRLCAREGKPFTGMVLIDSPLVVYREPDTADGSFPPEVKNRFYENLAVTFAEEQVIILENDPPPDSLLASANVVLFTGNDQGRQGFIPRRPAPG